jgi:hypothetical protein
MPVPPPKKKAATNPPTAKKPHRDSRGPVQRSTIGKCGRLGGPLRLLPVPVPVARWQVRVAHPQAATVPAGELGLTGTEGQAQLASEVGFRGSESGVASSWHAVAWPVHLTCHSARI